MSVCAHTRTHARKHVPRYVCMYVCMYVCTVVPTRDVRMHSCNVQIQNDAKSGTVGVGVGAVGLPYSKIYCRMVGHCQGRDREGGREMRGNIALCSVVYLAEHNTAQHSTALQAGNSCMYACMHTYLLYLPTHLGTWVGR
ncbi:hypothetical protein BO71DRAFT_77172 [Aspergillus ellipticus CBS 707.79]|uniref:Uncharacterized protein n=1 Tax=Aspergillus ellipticus CBS 707.79 TaxID=1448320 RepID=A0A319D062_9EURO|nr:hypothetical protein BO71DRAFT_77172 [Aspergillus ellipticus CBS 707.79]